MFLILIAHKNNNKYIIYNNKTNITIFYKNILIENT